MASAAAKHLLMSPHEEVQTDPTVEFHGDVFTFLLSDYKIPRFSVNTVVLIFNRVLYFVLLFLSVVFLVVSIRTVPTSLCNACVSVLEDATPFRPC